MAATVPEPTARPRVDHCGFHHSNSDQCPPLDPDLGDLIPDLLDRSVALRLIPALPYPVACEDCIADDVHPRVADAIAWVAHHAPSEALPGGYTYRDPVCAEHLWAAMTWQLHRRAQTWIEIPHDFWPVP